MLIDIKSLIAVEKTNPSLVHVLTLKIQNDGYFTEPILVDKDTKIILNGHHRIASCKRLGLTKIPCIIIDYQGKVTITSNRGNIEITKKYLLKRLQPFKTVNFPDLNQYVDRVKIPLTQLM